MFAAIFVSKHSQEAGPRESNILTIIIQDDLLFNKYFSSQIMLLSFWQKNLL